MYYLNHKFYVILKFEFLWGRFNIVWLESIERSDIYSSDRKWVWKVIRQKQRTEKEKGRQRSQFLLEADEKSKKAVWKVTPIFYEKNFSNCLFWLLENRQVVDEAAKSSGQKQKQNATSQVQNKIVTQKKQKNTSIFGKSRECRQKNSVWKVILSVSECVKI